MDSRNRRCETRSWSNKSKEPPAEEHRRHLEDEKGQVTDSPLWDTKKEPVLPDILTLVPWNRVWTSPEMEDNKRVIL